MAAVNELCPVVGTQAACEILGLPRASFYRQQRPTFGPSKNAVSARALSLTERGAVLACLHEERFQIAHRPLYSPPCWTKAFITVRFARCTGSWQKRVKLGSVAIS